MKKIRISILILSFFSLVFIGSGGVQVVAKKVITETNILSSLLTSFNNDQVYRVGSKDHLLTDLVATEIIEIQESSVNKVIYNSFLNLEIINKQVTGFHSDLLTSQAPTKIDRYLLLQTFRL